MKINIVSPTKAYVDGTEEELASLTLQLSYLDLSAKHELNRLSKNHWFKRQNPVKWQINCDILKAQIPQCLVFKEGPLTYIRPGSIPYIENILTEIESKVAYPKIKKMSWLKPIPYQLYDYQVQSIQKLIEAKHANVSITTGGGKSNIILSLCRETGLKCAVIAPSKAIFSELVEKFEYHFGKGKIGQFGAGKKKIGKLITVCIGDSLCNLKKDTEEWRFFSTLDMIVVDESHSWASNTLEQVCHTVFENVPYRFFLSATQSRGDGGIKLLQSVIGSTVHTLTTREAVDKGYISKHEFKIIQIESSDPNLTSSDPLAIKREHFLRNKNIANFSAKLSNVFGEKGAQILILVEELNQIAMLAKKLTVPFGYAHSETNKERLAEMGLEKVNVDEQIEKFNKNEIKVLIGTSTIHTGVNIYPMTHTINWVGGSSEVKTKQAAVGRSIRLPNANPYKAKCGPKESVTIYDFDVLNNYVLERHLEERIKCFQDSGDNLIKYVRLKR